jgi:phosphatidate cytidylyltransferase
MTPELSPKKTWQGLIGGLAASVGVAIAICSIAEVLLGGLLVAVAFGLTVGIAGVFGDLAESPHRRDQNQRCLNLRPRFWRRIDVIDSLLFAA